MRQLILFGLFGPAYAPPTLLNRQREKHVYQQRKIFTVANVCLAMIAIAGCEQSTDAHRHSAVVAPSTESSTTMAKVDDALSRAQQPEAGSAVDVQAELATLQSQVGALTIERDRLVTQLESHQAQGHQRLAALKAQWSELQAKDSASNDPAARERFAELARVEMEGALMMDQEYRAHLDETEAKLRETQTKMNSLRAEERIDTPTSHR